MSVDGETLLRLLLSQRAMLIGYIASIVRDRDLAEDLFQDVALLIFRKGEVLQDEAQFPAWARKVARYEALNALRKRKHAPQPLNQDVLELLDAQWSASDKVSPARSLEALRECLQKLTVRARRLVELRYQENLSGQSLAQRVEQPFNTVYVALSRAHRALAECVKARLARDDA